MLARRVWDITLEPDQAQGLDLWRGFLAAGEQGGEYRLRCKDGHILEVEYRAVAHIQPGRHLSILRDITERKQAERKLQQHIRALDTARRQLAYLSRRVLEAHETEQRRLAHELHDQFAQSLVALKMNLGMVQKRIEHPAPKKLLDQGLEIVNQMIEQVRDLSRLLRPPLLDELGLIRALDAYVQHQKQASGLDIHIHVEPKTFTLPPFLETVCFRIAQEALHNAIRHAKARRVNIEMQQDTTKLDLRVRDDGVGFDVQAAQQRAKQCCTLGLHTMQERVQLAGGILSIHSVLSQGTEVRVCLPLRPDACHTDHLG